MDHPSWELPLDGTVPSSRSPSSPFRVAIALSHSVPFLERFLVGVVKHARAAGWSFVRMPAMMEASLDWVRDWDGDGVLAAIRHQPTRPLPDIPVVNVVDQVHDMALPLVSIDHRAVGRLAARHLRERGLADLAFYGYADRSYSLLRRVGFTEALAEDGITPAILEAKAHGPQEWLAHQRHLQRWVSRLPHPVGVFACSDERAVEVLEVCRRLGRRVPQDLAILGVDNDPVLCEFSEPPLSSIVRDDERAGRAAAALLQRLMEARRRGRAAPATPERIDVPPVGIVSRASSAQYSPRHPQVATLLRRLEEHLSRPVAIADLMADLPLGRRRLEALFRQELGISPYQFLLRARVRRAQDLLARPGGASRAAIAAACGFTSAAQLRAALAKTTAAPARP